MSELIYGRNPVISCLEGSRKIEKVMISKTIQDNKFLNLCKEKSVKYSFISNEELNKITHNKNHQGVCCYIEDFKYTELKDFLLKVKDKVDSTIVMLDGIEDPVNFGSIIRTSSCFNVDAIIIGKNRQVQITPTVTKVATGAEEYVPIIQVNNLNQALRTLKDNNYWIVASDGKGDKDYSTIDYSGKMCVIVGSEGRGISQLVLKNSDFVCKIPISGPITSLNASISCAIFLAYIQIFRNSKK